MAGSNVPKPEAFRRRRNSVPAGNAQRQLPIAGRDGPAPSCSAGLGPSGRRWWKWAWSTPQATAWTHNGFSEALAKRAELEDLWMRSEPWDKVKLLPMIARLDEQFGLTPRSAAQLHLAFEEPPEPDATPAPVADIRDRLKGLGQ